MCAHVHPHTHTHTHTGPCTHTCTGPCTWAHTFYFHSAGPHGHRERSRMKFQKGAKSGHAVRMAENAIGGGRGDGDVSRWPTLAREPSDENMSLRLNNSPLHPMQTYIVWGLYLKIIETPFIFWGGRGSRNPSACARERRADRGGRTAPAPRSLRSVFPPIKTRPRYLLCWFILLACVLLELLVLYCSLCL